MVPSIIFSTQEKRESCAIRLESSIVALPLLLTALSAGTVHAEQPNDLEHGWER
jgi:hypothetical protein